jgi:hypothetical protein
MNAPKAIIVSLVSHQARGTFGLFDRKSGNTMYQARMSAFGGKADLEPSDTPLTRHVDGQILDPRSLNWLRIEAH